MAWVTLTEANKILKVSRGALNKWLNKYFDAEFIAIARRKKDGRRYEINLDCFKELLGGEWLPPKETNKKLGIKNFYNILYAYKRNNRTDIVKKIGNKVVVRWEFFIPQELGENWITIKEMANKLGIKRTTLYMQIKPLLGNESVTKKIKWTRYINQDNFQVAEKKEYIKRMVDTISLNIAEAAQELGITVEEFTKTYKRAKEIPELLQISKNTFVVKIRQINDPSITVRVGRNRYVNVENYKRYLVETRGFTILNIAEAAQELGITVEEFTKTYKRVSEISELLQNNNINKHSFEFYIGRINDLGVTIKVGESRYVNFKKYQEYMVEKREKKISTKLKNKFPTLDMKINKLEALLKKLKDERDKKFPPKD
jgi:DNA-binding transcriptional ArsR family regulator